MCLNDSNDSIKHTCFRDIQKLRVTPESSVSQPFKDQVAPDMKIVIETLIFRSKFKNNMLRILIFSRSTPRLLGEHLWSLEPLPYSLEFLVGLWTLKIIQGWCVRFLRLLHWNQIWELFVLIEKEETKFYQLWTQRLQKWNRHRGSIKTLLITVRSAKIVLRTIKGV